MLSEAERNRLVRENCDLRAELAKVKQERDNEYERAESAAQTTLRYAELAKRDKDALNAVISEKVGIIDQKEIALRQTEADLSEALELLGWALRESSRFDIGVPCAEKCACTDWRCRAARLRERKSTTTGEAGDER